MKAFIFLIFSVLIHCYIFRSALLGNSQESPLDRLFLRGVKASKYNTKKTPQKTLIKNRFKEPSFFAPKKLSKKEISNLDYRAGLIYLIQSRAVYPLIAQDLEQSGTVVLSVELDKNGKFLSHKLHEKSEFDLLNAAALDSLNSLKAYKPLPKVLYPQATFLVPIHFF